MRNILYHAMCNLNKYDYNNENNNDDNDNDSTAVYDNHCDHYYHCISITMT